MCGIVGFIDFKKMEVHSEDKNQSFKLVRGKAGSNR